MQDTIKIVRKNIKNVYLKITSNLEIILSIPLNFTELQIQQILIDKQEWIKHQKLKFQTFKPIVHNNTDEFQYLGSTYIIKIMRSNKRDIFFQDGYIVITLKLEDEESIKSKLLEQWSYDVAKMYFKQLMVKYLPLVDKKVNRITVRKMTTRWGSCNPVKGYINLNIELLKKPLEQIEYVIFHELTHLLYYNHNKGFYDFLSLHMPDWQIRHQKLNNFI